MAAAPSVQAIRLYRHIARESLKLPRADRIYYRNFARSVRTKIKIKKEEMTKNPVK